jgi:hypothetical protein
MISSDIQKRERGNISIKERALNQEKMQEIKSKRNYL